MIILSRDTTKISPIAKSKDENLIKNYEKSSLFVEKFTELEPEREGKFKFFEVRQNCTVEFFCPSKSVLSFKKIFFKKFNF